LNKRERDVVAIHLATREFLNVIGILLAAVIRAEAALPTELASRLTRWSQTYAGHPNHAVICDRVGRASAAGHPLTPPKPAVARVPVETNTQQH